MNGYLGRCVEEFGRVGEEIGFLPASLWASLIILMTIVGSIVMMVLAVLVLASSPLVLAIIWVASSKSRPNGCGRDEAGDIRRLVLGVVRTTPAPGPVSSLPGGASG